LRALIVPSAAPMPLAAYGINRFGQIAGNHHLLTPNYASATLGRPFSVAATLGEAVMFEYWAAGLPPSACAAGGVQLQVRASAARVGRWRPAATIADCDGDGEWRTVSVRVPANLRGTPARVDVRLVAAGAGSSAIAYLRRFQTR
jgi:hypothetical protein